VRIPCRPASGLMPEHRLQSLKAGAVGSGAVAGLKERAIEPGLPHGPSFLVRPAGGQDAQSAEAIGRECTGSGTAVSTNKGVPESG
jgi:hypothetical protein